KLDAAPPPRAGEVGWGRRSHDNGAIAAKAGAACRSRSNRQPAQQCSAPGSPCAKRCAPRALHPSWKRFSTGRVDTRPLASILMTYIVTDNCIACKYTDCVEVCPVDCFYEGENMLVIHPDECI